jgi:superfamily II DNA/RNA helicase
MTTFADLNLDKKVLKAVEETGYTSPTPIQAGAIPPALEGPRRSRHRPNRYR